MGRKIVVAILFLFIATTLFSVDTPLEIEGYYKSVDSRKGFTTSIMAVYLYKETLYGRVIVAFDEKDGSLVDTYKNPTKRIDKLATKPLVSEIDLFWGHELDKEIYTGGFVIDPRTGYKFKSDIWLENGKLVLKGKFGPFGVRQLFYPATEADLPKGVSFPPLNSFIPNPLD